MFRIHHRLIGSVEPFEYLEKTAGETVLRRLAGDMSDYPGVTVLNTRLADGR